MEASTSIDQHVDAGPGGCPVVGHSLRGLRAARTLHLSWLTTQRSSLPPWWHGSSSESLIVSDGTRSSGRLGV